MIIERITIKYEDNNATKQVFLSQIRVIFLIISPWKIELGVSICNMITIQRFVFNEFQENSYVLFDESKECVIIDPGCYSQKERHILTEFIQSKSLKPVKLLNTHCHIDHVLGNEFVIQQYGIDLYLHKEELFTYKDTARWTALFGIPPLEIPERLVFVDEAKTIEFGTSSLSIAFTPGHSVASITFYNSQQQFAIVGDVLFRGSIGRTDLPGGNMNTLLNSIQQVIMPWPDTMAIYSGHGEPTTVGHERKFNPFLNQ